MLEVIAHVISAERQHGERVAAHHADRADIGGGCFGADDRTQEDAVVPVEGLMDERYRTRPTAAEEDCADRHALRVLPCRIDYRALRCGRREAGVGMRARFAGLRVPLFASPVDEFPLGRIGADPFPPDIAVFGENDVGEHGILFDAQHGIRVRLHRRARRDTEKACFGIDGIEPAVGAEFHPGDVVADGFDLPAGNGGDKHGQVGLSAGAREGRGHILFDPLRIGDSQNEHVLGEPAFIARLNRGDAQGEALLSQKCIAAVARAVAPDGAFFGKMGDVLLFDGGAGPGRVFLARLERSAHRVQARHELARGSERFEHL